MVQMYIYYTNFPDDRTPIKVLVWGFFFVECLAAAFSAHAAWHALGAGWGDLEALIKPIWSFTALPPLCGSVALIVQLFFCWRIFALGKTVVIPIIIAVIAFVQCGFAFHTGIWIAATGNLRLGKIIPSYVVMLGASGICDLIITTTLVTFLLRARTSFHGTNTVLNRLITLTVETGMVTAIATWVEIVLLVVHRQDNLHFIICIMLGKLYSNTLLATLNARVALRASSQTSQQFKDAKKPLLWDDEPDPTTLHDPMTINAPMTLNVPMTLNSTPHRVHISTTTETRKDDIGILEGRGHIVDNGSYLNFVPNRAYY